MFVIAAHITLKPHVSINVATEAVQMTQDAIQKSRDAVDTETEIGRFKFAMWSARLETETGAPPTSSSTTTPFVGEAASSGTAGVTTTVSRTATADSTSSEPFSASSSSSSPSEAPKANECQDVANFCQGWNAESCASIVPVSAKVTIVQACAATCNQCSTVPKVACEDDHSFRDVLGWSCADWQQLNCYNARGVPGYSGDAENRLFAACPSSCLACQDCGRRQLSGGDDLRCRIALPLVEAEDVDACQDNAEFKDVNGNTCRAWRGVQCQRFPGYAEADIDEVKEECRESCGLCNAASESESLTLPAGISVGTDAGAVVKSARGKLETKDIMLAVSLGIVALICIIGTLLLKGWRRKPRIEGLQDSSSGRTRDGLDNRLSRYPAEWDHTGLGSPQGANGLHVNFDAGSDRTGGLHGTQYDPLARMGSQNDLQTMEALRTAMSRFGRNATDLGPLDQFMAEYMADRSRRMQPGSNAGSAESYVAATLDPLATTEVMVDPDDHYDLKTLHEPGYRKDNAKPLVDALSPTDRFKTARVEFAESDERLHPTGRFKTTRLPRSAPTCHVGTANAAQGMRSGRTVSPTTEAPCDLMMKSQQIFKAARPAARIPTTTSSGYPLLHGGPEEDETGPGYVLSAAGKLEFENKMSSQMPKECDGESASEPVYSIALARSRGSVSSSQASETSHVYSTARAPDDLRGGDHVYARARVQQSFSGVSEHLYSTANHAC